MTPGSVSERPSVVCVLVRNPGGALGIQTPDLLPDLRSRTVLKFGSMLSSVSLMLA